MVVSCDSILNEVSVLNDFLKVDEKVKSSIYSLFKGMWYKEVRILCVFGWQGFLISPKFSRSIGFYVRCAYKHQAPILKIWVGFSIYRWLF